MAKDLNKVQVIGRLGADPEVRMTNEGNTVTTFRVASSRSWKKADGQLGEETEWFRVVAWNKLAEVCAEYLRKGSRVYIEGRLKTRSWDDAQTGEKRYITEVIADDMIMLDSKNSNTGGGSYGDADVGYSNDIESEPAPARQAAPARRAPAPVANNGNGGSRPAARPASGPAPAPRRPVATVEDDEDLPF
jgi:single-strand DNA-binding protein